MMWSKECHFDILEKMMILGSNIEWFWKMYSPTVIWPKAPMKKKIPCPKSDTFSSKNN